MPEEEKWRLPLIIGTMEIRDSRWEVLFDSENSSLKDDDLQAIIHHACCT